MGAFNNIFAGRQKDREALRADEAATKESITKMQALGMDEYGHYNTGVLAPAQEKLLSTRQEESSAAADNYAKESHASDSFNKSLHDVFKMDSLIMREAMREQSWAKAIQALGFSMEETKQLIIEHTQERQQSMQIFQSLMGAIGGLIGMFTKSKGGK